MNRADINGVIRIGQVLTGDINATSKEKSLKLVVGMG